MQDATEKNTPRDATAVVVELRALLIDVALWLIARGALERPAGHPDAWLAIEGFGTRIVALARVRAKEAPFGRLLSRRERLYAELLPLMRRTFEAAFRATRRERAYSDIVDQDDAWQDGISGLMRAVELFDASRGYKFPTFAQHWVQMSTRRSAQKVSRVKCSALTSANKEKRDEARRTMGRKQAYITGTYHAAANDPGLDVQYNTEILTVRSALTCEANAEEVAETKRFQRRLTQALERLKPRHREIAIAHIYREETMLEIADRMGVSRQAIGAAWLTIEAGLKKALGASGSARAR